MRRFDKAIRAIDEAILKEVGKAAQEFAEHGQVRLAVKTRHVLNLKRAIKILEDHPENKLI